MQDGGPVAFYETAATLIPILLLGGVALELVKVPRRRANPSLPVVRKPGRKPRAQTPPGRRSWRYRPLIMSSILLPLGLAVILVELVALDSIATGSTSQLHAWVVVLAIFIGMAIAVFGVVLPWMKERYEAPKKAVLLVAALASILAVVVITLFAQALNVSASSLAADVAKAPTQGLEREATDRIWLEHLIATSDYRIDKLEAEAASGGASAKRANAHRQTQLGVQDRQCLALEDLTSNESVDDDEVPPACSERTGLARPRWRGGQ